MVQEPDIDPGQVVDFINRHKDEPFLLYVPHSMPHVPIFASEAFEGKSGIGLYGDVTLELDWSVGQINQALKDNGLDDNTIVIFTSDNGPWTSYGNHAGRTPFREAKATSFEGGNRSACIIKYPPKLKANTRMDRAFFSVDLLPTLSHLAGINLPETMVMDGMNVWDLIAGDESAINPHDYYPLSTSRNFEGIMSGDGKWKLHIPHSYRTLITPGMDGQAGKYESRDIELSLFDMENDPMESKTIADIFGTNLPASSTKPYTGHTLGAAGAIESIASILSIVEGVVPPTINLNERDPEIDPKLNLTENTAQEREVNAALSNTFGFGGHNTSAIFKKYA